MNKKYLWLALPLFAIVGGAIAAVSAAFSTHLSANAKIESPTVVTIEGIGAGQGVSLHGEHAYFYGDVGQMGRGGVIREFTLKMKATGRDVELMRDGRPLITHPTGLTWHKDHGCFIGDTVDGAANIYQINWPQALEDGNLDNALVAHIQDDAAVNGCRPEFVELDGKTLLATADYSDKSSRIRLYDVQKMLKQKRTDVSGVVVNAIECGPFNQNLYWDDERGELTCIQNVVAGVGWRLERFNLAAAVEHGDARHASARVEQLTFSYLSELEGYRPLPDGNSVFVTASREKNVTAGRIRSMSRE